MRTWRPIPQRKAKTTKITAKKHEMLTHIMLPWWGWGYLLFVLVMFVASLFVKDPPDVNELGASALSLISICIFVVGFSNPLVPQFLGILIIPMTLIGLYWEFTRAVSETETAQHELAGEKSLSDGDRAFLLNVAIALNALVVVPGYVMGTVLSCYVLGIM